MPAEITPREFGPWPLIRNWIVNVLRSIGRPSQVPWMEPQAARQIFMEGGSPVETESPVRSGPPTAPMPSRPDVLRVPGEAARTTPVAPLPPLPAIEQKGPGRTIYQKMTSTLESAPLSEWNNLVTPSILRSMELPGVSQEEAKMVPPVAPIVTQEGPGTTVKRLPSGVTITMSEAPLSDWEKVTRPGFIRSLEPPGVSYEGRQMAPAVSSPSPAEGKQPVSPLPPPESSSGSWRQALAGFFAGLAGDPTLPQKMEMERLLTAIKLKGLQQDILAKQMQMARNQLEMKKLMDEMEFMKTPLWTTETEGPVATPPPGAPPVSALPSVTQPQIGSPNLPETNIMASPPWEMPPEAQEPTAANLRDILAEALMKEAASVAPAQPAPVTTPATPQQVKPRKRPAKGPTPRQVEAVAKLKEFVPAEALESMGLEAPSYTGTVSPGTTVLQRGKPIYTQPMSYTTYLKEDEAGNVTGVMFNPNNARWETVNLGKIGKPVPEKVMVSHETDAEGNTTYVVISPKGEFIAQKTIPAIGKPMREKLPEYKQAIDIRSADATRATMVSLINQKLKEFNFKGQPTETVADPKAMMLLINSTSKLSPEDQERLREEVLAVYKTYLPIIHQKLGLPYDEEKILGTKETPRYQRMLQHFRGALDAIRMHPEAKDAIIERFQKETGVPWPAER